ncbi:PLDc N-terminal domain-containing protein [Sinomonas sp. ASV322]|uniref:PLDc N-terminal domain-containing protein n=1 Tax=Sinomonas sp. ASV322 TaxID=3041920 RepID=UPI0035A3B8D1
MELWQWLPIALSAAVGLAWTGAIVWATFDVLNAPLSTTARPLWILVLWAFPVVGLAIWLYARSSHDISR